MATIWYIDQFHENAKKMAAILSRTQAEALPSTLPDGHDAVAYCNACINSGLGAKYGVPEKGMISWQSQLRPAAMQKVSSYILSLQGSNPPNAKAPQGDLYNSGVSGTGAAPDSTTTAQNTPKDSTDVSQPANK